MLQGAHVGAKRRSELLQCFAAVSPVGRALFTEAFTGEAKPMRRRGEGQRR